MRALITVGLVLAAGLSVAASVSALAASATISSVAHVARVGVVEPPRAYQSACSIRLERLDVSGRDGALPILCR